MPIKHGVQLVDWLRGFGVARASVNEEGLEIDQRVKMTADLGTSPGSPLGPDMFWHGYLDAAAGAVNTHVVLFDGGPGGAVIDWVTVHEFNEVNVLTWNNYIDTGPVFTQDKFFENLGSRAWDLQPGADGAATFAGARGVVPLSRVRMTLDTTAPVYAVTGVRRSGQMLLQSGFSFPTGVFLPPGLSYGFVSSTINQRLVIGFSGRIFPIRGTGDLR